jgi:hypothetical protein
VQPRKSILSNKVAKIFETGPGGLKPKTEEPGVITKDKYITYQNAENKINARDGK